MLSVVGVHIATHRVLERLGVADLDLEACDALGLLARGNEVPADPFEDSRESE